ncbi:MAG: hypothetical protein R3293_00800 [Candidatus Promineifilaceae bacterium]|nr:hypothetical protein [Candidatus Promineifilaceae bacterium]
MSTFDQIVRHKRGLHSSFYDPGTPRNYSPDLELEPTHLDIDLYVNNADEQLSGNITTTIIAPGENPNVIELDTVDFASVAVRDLDGHDLT